MIKKILILSFWLVINSCFSQGKSIKEVSSSPNPFRLQTTIKFISEKEQGVYLIIKNILGKSIYRKGHYAQKGKVSINFERDSLAPGVYIYTLQSDTNTISKRFVIK